MIRRIYWLFFLAINLGIATKGFGQIDCSKCAVTLLQRNDLKELSLEELALLRNELMARKGYVFKNELYARYFEAQSWYQIATQQSSIQLTPIEEINVALIRQMEQIQLNKRESAISALKEIQLAVKQRNTVVLKRYFGPIYGSKDDFFNSSWQDFETLMSKLNFDEVHWNKHKGCYKLTVDNGYVIQTFEVQFYKDSIQLQIGSNSHSAIFGAFNDGISSYQSESEYQIWWLFHFYEKAISYKGMNGAG